MMITLSLVIFVLSLLKFIVLKSDLDKSEINNMTMENELFYHEINRN